MLDEQGEMSEKSGKRQQIERRRKDRAGEHSEHKATRPAVHISSLLYFHGFTHTWRVEAILENLFTFPHDNSESSRELRGKVKLA